MRLALFLSVSIALGPVAPAIHANVASARAEHVRPTRPTAPAPTTPSFPVERATQALLDDLDHKLLAPSGAVHVERAPAGLARVSVHATPLLAAPGTAAVLHVHHVYAPSDGGWARVADLSTEARFGAQSIGAAVRLEVQQAGAAGHPLDALAGWTLKEEATASFASPWRQLAPLVAGPGGPQLLAAAMQGFERTLTLTDAAGRATVLSGAEATWSQLLTSYGGAASPPSDGGGTPGSNDFVDCLLLCLGLLALPVGPATLLCLAVAIVACAGAEPEEYEVCVTKAFALCGLVLAATEAENLLICLLACLGAA
ncbi:MAG: hypothetical protein AAF682_13500 [Planctomycetota bacterium]